ncbi:Pentatricopeptide repeat-containing protein [Apostasia shenzhenica]|uniref:Pentatricopeptide repeat-containing protein n=1 Tax=Apostasia shenzhenica TaxID=1088818 RepID=A0A2I0BH84_9ASPA|nr:Pentatricopeptide repeat-containing protein [Apostasia shenzhenica]
MPLNHALAAAKRSCHPFFSVHDLILRAQSLAQSQQTHAHAAAAGLLDRDLPTCAALLIAYSTFGDPSSSLRLFELSPLKLRGAFLWNALVRALSRSGLHLQALSFYNSMIQNSISPDDRTFPFALSACSAAGATPHDYSTGCKGRELHSAVVKLGFASDIFVGNTLLSFYGACRDPGDAWKVFDEMPTRDVISWNSMISVFSLNEMRQDSMNCFSELVREGLPVNSVSLISVLPASGELQAKFFGSCVHGCAIKAGLDSQVTVGNALIGMHGKCGDTESSVKVFYSIMNKNDASWNSIIGILVQSGCSAEALEMFRDMVYSEVEPNAITVVSLLPSLTSELSHIGKEVHGYCMKNGMDSDIFVVNSLVDMYAKCGSLNKGSVVFDRIKDKNVVSWNAMIANCAENGDELKAIRLVREMQLFGQSPNAVTFTSVLPACSRIASLEKGREIHAKSIQKGYNLDLFITNALTDMYAKCGRLDLARNLFSISLRDEISYNTLIIGYSQSTLCLEALLLFREMGDVGFKYDAVSFMGVLSACANFPALKQGREVHCKTVRKLLDNQLFVGNSIVDMYNRCGRIDFGRRIFDRIQNKDAASWNSMIMGYGMQGELEAGLDLFDSMIYEDVEYDHVSYVAALSICSHGGLIERGKRYFGQLLLTKNINLTQMHCACMVDLLGRAGLMDEAADFIKKMPFEADFNVWGAMLGACRVHRNIELGRWAADHLFQLRPEHSGYYILLANMYAEDGRWDEANKVRKLMKNRSVKKNPACSWIESSSRPKVFSVGEQMMGHEEEDHFDEVQSLQTFVRLTSL